MKNVVKCPYCGKEEMVQVTDPKRTISCRGTPVEIKDAKVARCGACEGEVTDPKEIERWLKVAVRQGVEMSKPKAIYVTHHDDPPCEARLFAGLCQKCGVVPDMQSLSLWAYCPACDVPLKKMLCPRCGISCSKPLEG